MNFFAQCQDITSRDGQRNDDTKKELNECLISEEIIE